MKKLLGIAALLLAFSPLTQAQEGPPGHPEARNDRRMEQSHERVDVRHHRAPPPKRYHRPHRRFGR